MELDSLKQIWKEAARTTDSAPPNSAIINMMTQSSKSPIGKMIRNVKLEASLIIVVFGAVAIYYFLAFRGRFNTVAWFYLATAAFFVCYYYFKWKLLQEMQCAACQVKSNLERQLKTLGNYVRFYLLVGTALVPVLLIFLGFVFYYKFPNGNFSIIFPPMYKTPGAVLAAWMIWLLTLTVITVFTYWLNKWAVNCLYGKHVKKLALLLTQMEEE